MRTRPRASTCVRRRVTGGSRSEEQVLVPVGDIELNSEALRRRVFLVVLLLTACFLGLYGAANYYIFRDVAKIQVPEDEEIALHVVEETDAGVIVPYTIWKTYGDTRLLARHWASMTKFMESHISSMVKFKIKKPVVAA